MEIIITVVAGLVATTFYKRKQRALWEMWPQFCEAALTTLTIIPTVLSIVYNDYIKVILKLYMDVSNFTYRTARQVEISNCCVE